MFLEKNGCLHLAYEYLDKFYMYSTEKLSSESVYTVAGVYKTEFDPKDPSIKEMFDLEFGVEYDDGIPGAPGQWIVQVHNEEIWNDKLTLNGCNYPGWKWVDRGWGQKEIPFHKCTGYFLRKSVWRQNGEELRRSGRKEVKLSRMDFLRAVVFYRFFAQGCQLSEYEGEKFIF